MSKLEDVTEVAKRPQCQFEPPLERSFARLQIDRAAAAAGLVAQHFHHLRDSTPVAADGLRELFFLGQPLFELTGL
jgi:hypothetical protein